MAEKIPPSPAEVEALAEEMCLLKARVADIEDKAKAEAEVHLKRLEELRQLATDWIRTFGSAHAEKSKILRGIVYEIMGTFGMSTSIDAAAAEAFRLALVKAKQARVLSKIFAKTVRFDLKPEAGEILASTKLKPRLQALWAKCMVLTPRTPVITPRLRKKEPEAA